MPHAMTEFNTTPALPNFARFLSDAVVFGRQYEPEGAARPAQGRR